MLTSVLLYIHIYMFPMGYSMLAIPYWLFSFGYHIYVYTNTHIYICIYIYISLIAVLVHVAL